MSTTSESGSSSRTDHYQVLGVARTAAHADIRRAYLSAARKWHPDQYVNKPTVDKTRAEKNMARINQAWSVLGEADSRAAYDRQLVSYQRPRSSTGGIRTEDGVTRIDPRLLDPEFLAARRQAQQEQISGRTSLIMRVAPVVGILGLLAAIFVFTAYARSDEGEPTATTVPGPNLGAGIEGNDCVRVMTGPALLEQPCTATADGRVIGARLPDGVCPLGTVREVELATGVVACLADVQ